MKSNLMKVICLLVVVCFSFGCAKKESSISNNNDIDARIKEIGYTHATFDGWAKTVLTTKFGSAIDYSIKEINIKSIQQFKIAEVVATANGSEFNYFILSPAEFVENNETFDTLQRPLIHYR